MISIIIPVGDDTWFSECIRRIWDTAGSVIKEIVVIRDPDRRGPAWARNRGLEKATGNYVFFCDADDIVGDLKALITAPAADLVVGSFVKEGLLNAVVKDFSVSTVVDKDGLKDYVRKNLANPRTHQMLSGCWGKLFKRSIIERCGIRFNERLRTAEDLDFNFEYLKNCETVCFIPQIVYRYRKRAGSLTMRPDAGMLDVLTVLKKLEPYGDIGQSFIYHAALYVKRAPWLASVVMEDPEFKRHIRRYVPAKGNYRLLPWLMRLGVPKLAEWGARL